MTAHRHRRRAGAQRGVVLIVALVVLVIMSLAGLMMFRATGSGVDIAGNVAFKQNATSLADLGVEKARAYLVSFGSNAIPLDSDSPTDGYYASWHESFDPLTFDWSTAKDATPTGDDGTGNQVRYIIHRLCSVAGATTAPGQHCAIPASDSPLGSGGGGAGAGGSFSGRAGQAYYRITARVSGPRSTVSYVQVIMF